jgi:hypothetical protein
VDIGVGDNSGRGIGNGAFQSSDGLRVKLRQSERGNGRKGCKKA